MYVIMICITMIIIIIIMNLMIMIKDSSVEGVGDVKLEFNSDKALIFANLLCK